MIETRTLNQNTIYFSLPMQIYINKTIKQPILEAMVMLFSSGSSKVDKLKAGITFLKAFNAIKGIPEPTKENTWHPNSHNLIDLREWLISRCSLGSVRMTFIRRVFNFVIVLYDFDPPWRWIMDAMKDKAFEMDWEHQGYGDDWSNTYNWWNEENS